MDNLTELFRPAVWAPNVETPTFHNSLAQSFAMIFASEFGDRTFFVAALLAMKHSRLHVFIGAFAAAAVMHVATAIVGNVFPKLIDRHITTLVAAVLFLFFGLKHLREWYKLRDEDDDENEELEEAEEQLKEMKERRMKNKRVSPIMIEAFMMTLMAEWGDQSHLATIGLAAAREIWGVAIGGVVGHAICVGIAVVGGKLLAERISERAVALMGGISFLIFAAVTAAGMFFAGW